MTQDSNAGERNETPEPSPEEQKAAQERQEIADGHRYMPQDMRDARDAQAARKKPERPKKPAKPQDKAHSGERIAKALARAGLASRREVERLIGLGLIAVNGRILETPAVLVKPTDVITVEGKVMGKAEPTRLWRYHKPIGLLTTERDPEGRPTVFDKLPRDLPRVLKVGRLDINSEGLLLLTNDGELARALELPSSGWVRRYRARALGQTTQARLDTLKDGTTVDGVIYGPIEATLDKVQEKADGRANVWITVAITEGKNREVRKVLESLGLKVNRLIRLAYGPFQLGNLEPGEVEEVGPRVIRELLGDLILPHNLPPETATRTEARPDRARRDDDRAPQGRRGGGDRFRSEGPREGGFKSGGFKNDRTGGDRPARPRRDFAEKREYRDRDFDERPRFEGDGVSRDRKPQGEGGERSSYARKPYAPKPYGQKAHAPRDGDSRRPYRNDALDSRPPEGSEAGAYERAKREFGGAGEGRERKTYDRPRPGGDRPQGERPYKKPYAPRGEGDRSQGDRPYKKPYAAREDGAERRSFDGPRKPRFDGDRPQGERSYKKPYTPRTEGDRPQGDRPYKKPYAARDAGGERGERKSFDGPRKPRFDGDRPQGGDRPYKKPYALREDGARKSFDGPRAPRAEREDGYRKPYAKKPYAPRPEGGDDRPRGERKGFGGRPGGKPAGRKPRA